MNDRGQYGSRPPAFAYARGQYGTPLVGQGSIFGHTPGEVEDELDQLHSEIMQFGQEVIETIENPAAAGIQADVELQRLRAEEKAAYAYIDTLPDPPPASEWMLKYPKDILRFSQEYAARVAAVKKARALSDKRADYMLKLMAQPPSSLATWANAVWDPFARSWLKWRSEKKDIPLQMWWGSGVWDRIQEYRQKFIAIRRNAPFKTMTPEPLTPEGRKDPSLTGAARDVYGGIGSGIGSFGSILKWSAIGVLGIGAVVALASIATSWKKKEDPLEKWVTQAERGARLGARSLPQARVLKELKGEEP